MATLYGGISQDNTILYLAGTQTSNASTSFVDTDIGYGSSPGYSYINNIQTVNIENNIQPDSMAYGFCNCYHIQNYINGEYLDTSNVTSMRSLFYGCSNDNFIIPNISNGDVSNVTNMGSMFYSCAGNNFVNLDLSNGNVSNVTNMSNMFYGCSGSNFKVLNLKKGQINNNCNCNSMFHNCNNLETIYCNYTGNPNSSTFMFDLCNSLVGAIPFETSKRDGQYANPETGYFTYILPKANNFKFKHQNDGVSTLDMMYPIGSYAIMGHGESPTARYGGTGTNVTSNHNGKFLAAASTALTTSGASVDNITYTPTVGVNNITLTASHAIAITTYTTSNVSTHSYAHTHTPNSTTTITENGTTYKMGGETHANSSCPEVAGVYVANVTTPTRYVRTSKITGTTVNDGNVGNEYKKTNMNHAHSIPSIAAANATATHTHTVSNSASTVNLTPSFQTVCLWRRDG